MPENPTPLFWPVTVIGAPRLQLTASRVIDEVFTETSAGLAELTPITTSPVGCALRWTVKVAVPPDPVVNPSGSEAKIFSLLVPEERGTTTNRASSDTGTAAVAQASCATAATRTAETNAWRIPGLSGGPPLRVGARRLSWRKP